MSRAQMRLAYAGIFVVAGSVIAFQIALTRLFAIVMWHHLTYMVVSIALLGFGAAGSILTARRDALKTEEPFSSIAGYSAAYGVAVVLCFGFATVIRLDSLKIWEDKGNIVALLLFYAVITIPFLLAGLAIGKALSRLAEHVNQLYFWDLTGSALGGGLCAWLLKALGSTGSIAIAATWGSLGALLFAFAGRKSAVFWATVSLLITVACAISLNGGSESLRIPATDWYVPFAPGKEISSSSPEIAGRIREIDKIHSATAEVEVTPPFRSAPMIGGDFGIRDRQQINARGVAQDGTAPTMLYEGAGDFEAFPCLDDTQAASSYVCHQASGGGPADVLVIGVGGGPDVMVALYHDAKKVTAVEINTAMIEMVTDRYRDYIGDLFGRHRDRVELVNAEGRSYMRRRDERYDIIQMSGVDSFTALNSGAYTLSESFLYTTEAVREFYDHLQDGGYVNYSRFILNYPKRPRESLRLANIALTALREAGVESPASNIAIFQGIEWASIMIKRGAFGRPEIDALNEFAEVQGFKGLVYDPLLAADTEITAVAPNRGWVIRRIEKLANRDNAVATLLARPGQTDATGVLAAAFLARYVDGTEIGPALAPLTVGMPPTHAAAAATHMAAAIDADIEAARTEAERFAETRRIFHAVLRKPEPERQEFVAAYPYDISPCTDDRPFFFNYYRWQSLWDRMRGRSLDEGESTVIQERYHPDVPVGLIVLLSSLIQIFILAVVLILLPIRALGRSGIATPGKLRYLVYFTALGLGFMFIEIVLMTKLVIFLGHPTYSLSVVLTALLASAGLGSYLSARFRRLGYRQLGLIFVAIATTAVANILAVQHLLPSLLGWELPGRIAATVVLLAPLGTALGMAFPAGIRIVKQQCPQLLPWAWAINGFCSVLASILAIVISREVGFTTVLYIGIGIYAIGFLMMKPQSASESERSDSSEGAEGVASQPS